MKRSFINTNGSDEMPPSGGEGQHQKEEGNYATKE